MLRSDYDILVNAYEQFKKSNLSDDEVSFLMGKESRYFFRIFDPTEKSVFKDEYVPLFVPIFETTLEAILPKEFYPDEEVKITAKTKFNKKSTIYRHTVTYLDGTTSDEVVWQKKEQKAERKKENTALTAYLKQLIDERYFVVPRTALHLLILLRENFTKRFTVTDLKVSLGKLTRLQERKRPLLQRNSDNARYTYSEHYYIERNEDAEVLATLFGVDVAEISGLTVYTIADLSKKTLGFIGMDRRKLIAAYVFPDYHRIRLGTRMVDFAVALDLTNQLLAEVPLSSPALRFLEACGFKENEEDRTHREENGLKVVRLSKWK